MISVSYILPQTVIIQQISKIIILGWLFLDAAKIRMYAQILAYESIITLPGVDL